MIQLNIYTFLGFFSFIGYYKILSIVPYVIPMLYPYVIYFIYSSVCVCVCVCVCCVQLFATPWTGAYQLLCPWDSPSTNTGDGRHALLQEIFPTQELNPYFLCLLHGRQILYPMSHRRSPDIVVCICYPTSQTEKDKHMISLTCGIKKMVQMNLLEKQK